MKFKGFKMNTFTNTDSTIDSRDIIDRIEELQHADCTLTVVDRLAELAMLRELAEECEQCADDWHNGTTLIHCHYFEEYMNDMVEDCYELPKDMPFWMSIQLDYDALKRDYTSVDFNGEEYLIR